MTVVIPALNPDEYLISYVSKLKEAGFLDILVIDDGSTEEKQRIFSVIETEHGCVVFHHGVNKGKGRALKTAIHQYLSNTSSNCGIVTVDADGQHSVSDVLKVAKQLEQSSNTLVLGVRNFDELNVPPKSKLGNKITKGVIRFLYGGKISDTQTGLRGITNDRLPDLYAVKGERFEYETAVLLFALKCKVNMVEIEIETIYTDNNNGTHFRPVQDSLAIYGIIFKTFIKYSLSSFSSAIIDIGIFALISGSIIGVSLGSRIWIATICARVISSLYNYFINRFLVFAGKNKVQKSFLKYYLLCIIQMSLSASLILLFCSLSGFSDVGIKIVVDAILFIVSFQVQRVFVFK